MKILIVKLSSIGDIVHTLPALAAIRRALPQAEISWVVEKNTADLTITPGYKFKAIDGLLTNFHLPQSSLLVLTSTFGGCELIINSYKHAVRENYRFYSYGDCMLII